MNRKLLALTLAPVLVAGSGLLGCGEDTPTTTQRGMGDKGLKINNKAPDSAAASSRRSTPTTQQEHSQDAEELPFERPKRAELTRDDFSSRTRDPFHNYMSTRTLAAPEPVEIVRKERAVKLSQYSFEELRLIAIVKAGRTVAPRALFLASDNKSKSVKQGEYFSSAEVLLASVNRDYIEIEVVDPELTPGWNLQRGERRVIYLKDE